MSHAKSLNYNVYGENIGSVNYVEESDVYQVNPDGEGSGEFSIDNPDFNIRSLRGNAVMRWEFRPGSTLFLVWQQTRESNERTGIFDAGNDFSELIQSPSSHTILVKFSYWFGL